MACGLALSQIGEQGWSDWALLLEDVVYSSRFIDGGSHVMYFFGSLIED